MGAIAVRQPVGVVACITPFNFPIVNMAGKIGPALAMGNTVVVKPAPQDPLGVRLERVVLGDGLRLAADADHGYDAAIGEHSNIAASRVFVNDGGETKNRTTVGSHVRTGSDTMFVAPVTVGSWEIQLRAIARELGLPCD